ncbi:MAG: HEAT repeat domain-containing protein [Planctomycetota bacterium]
MESNKSTEAWIQDLSDELAPTRCTAAYELGKIGDDRAIEHLTSTLKDGYLSVRRHAAESLGTLGHEAAIGPLIEALGDDNEDFRAAVLCSLAKITDLIFDTPEGWVDWFRKSEALPNLR